MLICPDCTNALDSHTPPSCSRCGWEAADRAGVPEYLSSAHRESPLLLHYIANYDEIARDDLERTIVGDEYLDSQAARLRSVLGEVNGRTVLDLGMGQGRLSDLLCADGADVTGVDIAIPYIESHRGSNGFRMLLANAENLPFREEFDLVIASDVLEHVLNLGDALLSIHRALVPGGTLVARVPYKENLLQYAHLGETGHYDLVHLRDFNRENLRRSMTHAGFTVEGVSYEGFHAYRKRRWIAGSERVSRSVDRMLTRRYGTLERAHEMGPRMGRLLTVPAEITAIGRKV